MPFPQKDAEQLKEEINAILDKQSASAVERAKAILLGTELLVGSKSKMTEIRDDLDQSLKKFSDKTLFAPILRLIDIHLASKNVDVPDSDGKTLLYWALQMGDESSLELLVQVYHANINTAQDNNGSTLLHLTAKAGNLEGARQLIEICWATVDAQDNEGNTPLFDAIKAGNLPLVKFLVEKGANVNAVNKAGDTPLHIAAAYAPINVLRFLMTQKAAVNALNNEYESPLAWAAQKGRAGIVAALIKDYGADINAEIKESEFEGGEPLLNCAVQSGDENTVNYLLDVCRISPKHKKPYKKSALWTAASWGHMHIVQLLVKKHKVNAKGREHDRSTPLFGAAADGHLDIVKYLIGECKADVSVINDDLDSSLNAAIEGGICRSFGYWLKSTKPMSMTKIFHCKPPLLVGIRKQLNIC